MLLKNEDSLNWEDIKHLNICITVSQKMEKAMAPTPVLLPRNSHGWRSLVGCSPWGH